MPNGVRPILTDEDQAKAIIIHLTGQPEYPTPMLLQIIADIRVETLQQSNKGS